MITFVAPVSSNIIKNIIPILILFLFGIYSCQGDANSTTSDQPPIIQPDLPDSILGNLTSEQQYYQHFIFTIPAGFQNFQDSLTNWVKMYQPGGLRFKNWNRDSLIDLKKRWDTLPIVQPLYYVDYYDYLNLPPYPFWRVSNEVIDSVWFPVFSHDRVGLMDIQNSNASDSTLANWTKNLHQKTGVRSIVHFLDDQFAQRDFQQFLLAIQADPLGINLRLNLLDSADLNTYRNWADYQGLFIAETPRQKINMRLIGGVDLIDLKTDPFNLGNLPWDEWNPEKGQLLTFKNSTKRILNMKNRIQNNKLDGSVNERIESYQQRLLFSANTLIQNDNQLFPIRDKFTIYATENWRISRQILKENKVSFRQKDINNQLTEILEDESMKLIVLPDTLSPETLKILNNNENLESTIFCFSNPALFQDLKEQQNLIFAAKDKNGELTKEILIQQLTGRLAFKGDFQNVNQSVEGIKLPQFQLARTSPLFCGLSKDTLRQIDYAVRNAMNGRAFPGCQVLAVKNGCIVYDKSFGHHTYDRAKPVTSESMYDLASLTKVVSTTLMAMKLYENGAFDLSDSLKDYLPDTLRKHLTYPSTIRHIQFQELLIHKSGMPAGFPVLPYMQYTTEEIGRFDQYYCDRPDSIYSIEVAENFFLEECYKDSMWLKLNQIWLDPAKPYKYSDVNMNTMYFIMKSIIQNKPRSYGFTQSEKKLAEMDLYEKYLYKTFYNLLEMENTMYNPRKTVNKNRLVPTENERFWRKQLLQGYVHDPNAALYGGVAGNAGIFSTTNDLAVLAQMWLNGGEYDGKRYLNQETVDLFTRAQPNSHRGLGFNKPSLNTSAFGCADSAPQSTYGHTGFTGTCIWVDPDNEIIFIFLSNRVHPTVNNRIYNYGIRGNAHQLVYDAHLFD